MPFHISVTFCGQNMCRILIKICAEYCSIFHEEYSRAAGYFANTSFLLHPHFVSGHLPPPQCINQACASTRHQLWHHQKVQIDKDQWTPISKFLGSIIQNWLGGTKDELKWHNLFNVGKYLAFEKRGQSRQPTQRTNLFQVLSQSKFGPLLPLQDSTSIKISRYLMQW